MQINVTKTAFENLIDLIIDANSGLSGSLTPAKVTAGTPVAEAGTGGRNSKVTLTAVPNAGYSGTVDVNYTRLGMSSGVASVPSAIAINPSDTQAQIKTKIATALGLIQSEIDYYYEGSPQDDTTNPIDIPVNEDDTSILVSVQPKAGSLLYVGAALEIQLTVPDADIPLNVAIAVTDLNGFDAVQ